MIKSKRDLKYYLEADKIAMDVKGRRPHLIARYESDYIWKFQRALRYTEYYHNCKRGGICYPIYKLWQYRLFRLQLKCGFGVPINVFGPGLSISHLGPIVINGFAKVGKNCRLHPMTCIGVNGHTNEVATLGDNVYLSTGVKVIGPVTVADGVCLGANAVVTKSIDEENTTWGGVPAKKISDEGSPFPMNRRGADIAKREG